MVTLSCIQIQKSLVPVDATVASWPLLIADRFLMWLLCRVVKTLRLLRVMHLVNKGMSYILLAKTLGKNEHSIK